MAGLGFLLGMRHATDPDHVVAVSTIVARNRDPWRAALVGTSWGLGHTVTLFIVGGAMLVFKLAISPHTGLALEFAVALMLVGLGVANIVRAPMPATGILLDDPANSLRSHTRSAGIGLVHGLAGSAAVALLVLATVESTPAGMFYLLVFGLGTMAGMALITTILALPIAAVTAGRPAGINRIRIGAGVLSILFGLYLGWQIGVVDGLFSASPNWDPH